MGGGEKATRDQHHLKCTFKTRHRTAAWLLRTVFTYPYVAGQFSGRQMLLAVVLVAVESPLQARAAPGVQALGFVAQTPGVGSARGKDRSCSE